MENCKSVMDGRSEAKGRAGEVKVGITKVVWRHVHM